MNKPSPEKLALTDQILKYRAASERAQLIAELTCGAIRRGNKFINVCNMGTRLKPGRTYFIRRVWFKDNRKTISYTDSILLATWETGLGWSVLSGGFLSSATGAFTTIQVWS